MAAAETTKSLPDPQPVPFRHGLGNSLEMLRTGLGYLGIRAETMQLAGFSGVAFRTYWRSGGVGGSPRPSWDPDVVRVCSLDTLAAACDGSGWRLLWYRGAPSAVGWQFVVQSIDRGLPCLSCGFLGEPEETLVVGYRRVRERRSITVLTRHSPVPLPFDVSGEAWPGVARRGNAVALFDRTPNRRREDPDERIHRALRRAVRLTRERTLEGSERYHAGLDAYAAWIEALVTADPAPGTDEAAVRLSHAYGVPIPEDQAERSAIGLRHVLHRALTALAESRGWAAAFLRGPAAGLATGDAASAYAREADALGQAAEFWPAVILGSAQEYHLAPAPEGFEARTRREETARCLRLAQDEYRRAADEIDRRVPPTARELEEAGEDEGND